MRPAWEALASRARGLGAYLLSEEKISEVTGVLSVADLIRELDETPYASFLPPRGGGARDVEVGIARSLADRVDTLARWADQDRAALAPIFIEQDVRNVRNVLRGVLGELTPDQRLAGSIPTPTLGRRALEALARAESPSALAAMLVVWRHPVGSALFAEAKRARPDLFRLEVTLTRLLAREASLAARPGGQAMRRFVGETIDSQNIATALLLAGARSESPIDELFVDGGPCLGRRAFVAAASSGDPIECADALAHATRRTLFERPLRTSPTTSAAVAARILTARIEGLARDGIIEPLSALPVLLFVLSLRREAGLIRHALWSAALARGPSR